jgi:UPF0755 protein
MARKSTRLILGGIVLFTTLGLGAQAARMALFALAPASPGSTGKSVVEIRRGQGPSDIAKLLVSNHVVNDARIFTWVGRITHQWGKIKAGEYELSPAMTPIEVFGVITSGVSVAHPITVREGENMYEIATDIEAKGMASKIKLLELFRDPQFIKTLGLKGAVGPTLEGYLYPDTYFFNRTMAAEDMVRAMVRKFQQVWTPQIATRVAELGLNQLQALTLASIIEKETGNPKERPLISSVFNNRLRKKMKLQSDPTTIYGIWETYKGNIHRSDLLTPSAYNTYTLPGLPIGPISNPGKEAIEAALNPPQTEYLYFVSHNDGTTEFSATLEAHNRAVQKFQIDPKGRNGKSWRALRKNAGR